MTEWFRHHARDLPWRRDGYGAWGILVSEVMLQQTPVARVLAPLAAWLDRWPTPADLAAVPAGEAVRAWGRLGYPRRALRLHACAIAIVESHGGRVPADVEQLLILPGVGEYTARAVSVFAFGQRHPVVDTNVRRVVARAVHGNAEPAPPSTRRDHAEVELLLPTDAAEARVTSAAIMELGAIVCTARAPLCEECPIAQLCAWRANGYPAHDGPMRATQGTYAGSDRQVRGLILAMLRDDDTPVPAHEIEAVWADAVQRERAIASLIADGLVERDDAKDYRLPE
ncbi:MAG: A/G-specific adenine glycosylase [Terrimesophilobacter sp.]